MPRELANVSQILQKHWNDIPGDCAELRHRVVHDNETEQLYELALDAHRAATKDLSALQLELTELLEPPPVHTRHRRFVGYIAAAAIGAGLLAPRNAVDVRLHRRSLGPLRRRPTNRDESSRHRRNCEQIAPKRETMGYIVQCNGQKVLHCRQRHQSTQGLPTPDRSQPTTDLVSDASAREQTAVNNEGNDDLYGVLVYPYPTEPATQYAHVETTATPVLASILQDCTMDLPPRHPRCYPQFGGCLLPCR